MNPIFFTFSKFGFFSFYNIYTFIYILNLNIVYTHGNGAGFTSSPQKNIKKFGDKKIITQELCICLKKESGGHLN